MIVLLEKQVHLQKEVGAKVEIGRISKIVL